MFTDDGFSRTGDLAEIDGGGYVRLLGRWRPDDHAVACASAEQVLQVLGPQLRGQVVDVFTSPPHGTGRPSLAAEADPSDTADLLEGAPPLPVAPQGFRARHAVTSSPLDVLGWLLAQLGDSGALDQAAVELKASEVRPGAADAMAETLARAGLRKIDINWLYAGSPDGVPGVLGGGVVVGEH